MYGSQKSHYPWLKCHENEEKFDNDYVLSIDHRIKTTQLISMILVSFFTEDNVLSDEIKICYIFEYQSKENWAFRFFWDTRYKPKFRFGKPKLLIFALRPANSNEIYAILPINFVIPLIPVGSCWTCVSHRWRESSFSSTSAARSWRSPLRTWRHSRCWSLRTVWWICVCSLLWLAVRSHLPAMSIWTT